MSDFYSGSYLLSPFVPYTGLTVDKLNFIVCQLVAIALGRPFQKYFAAEPGSSNMARYAVSFVVGCLLCLFCFGHQILHVLFQGTVCLLIMLYADRRYARFAACIFAIAYLSACHLMRQFYDYGGYTLDITGPLMISTQRLSTLAFNIHDGIVVKAMEEADRKKKTDDQTEQQESDKSSEKVKPNLTERQMQHFVRDFPSLLQYYTYLVHFQGILVGPFVFYVDFRNYMDGTIPMPSDLTKEQREHYLRGTSRILVVAKWTLFFALVTLTMQTVFPLNFLAEDGFQSYSLISKWFYMTLACFVIRQRYYFAWSLGELSYLSSGCGFTGINKDTGKAEYKTVQNFDFNGVELSTSMKMAIDNWNISTVHWLRECVYERVPSKHATLAVFIASATWHGFYPGYYLLFISVAFFTTVARLARRHLRPHFQGSETAKLAYDVVTGLASLTTLNYGAGAFALLDLYKGLRFWWSMYFIVHVIAGLMYLGFVTLKPASSSRRSAPEAPRRAEVAQ
ncbi:hypothetical protein BOX15_Mlig016791g3 [Macrostomum lignano]|uniref:Lysophospholipid acyltransferase 1 n=2 Tax=Macrostomum lignano TaxID=282301 RepID=A0A1I8HGA1_9PLAT|nr:hypothetical protein BOX15_Mlig016791g3 [Macrostomum lignano]